MPQQRVPYSIGDWSGGVNDDLNPVKVAPNQLSLIRNWWWNGGTLEERPGLTKLNATAISGTPAIQGLFDYIYSGGASQQFVTVAGGKVYKDTSGTFSDITGSISITSGQNNPWTFLVFQDVLIAFGPDAPWKWTGTGNIAALGGSPPTARYCATKWNYLFVSGISTVLGLVRYAELNTYETWSVGNTIRVRTYGNDYITGLVPFGDMVIALCQNSLQKITYNATLTPPFINNVLLEGIGCPHQRAFVNVDDRAYFIDQHYRVRVIEPSDVIAAYNVPDVSTGRLTNTLKGLDLGRRPYICGAYYRPFESIIWAVSRQGATTNDFCIVMNVADNKPKFATWDELGINAITTRETTTGADLVVGNYGGRVYTIEGTSDDGTDITTQVDTRWEDLGSPQVEKLLRRVDVESRQPGGASMTLRTYQDYDPAVIQTVTVPGRVASGVSASQWGRGYWGNAVWPSGTAGEELVYNKLDINAKGRVIKLQFYNNQTQAGPRMALCRVTLYEKASGMY